MSNIQLFNWGNVEWIHEPSAANPHNVMSIGIYTIMPGQKQRRHIHYGDEQLLYVLSGHGMQIIGDVVSEKAAGSIFHIDAGSAHETTNTGEEPLVELVISIPANYGQRQFANSAPLNEKLLPLSDLAAEIAPLCEQFSEAIKIPIAVFENATPVVSAKNCGFSEKCTALCGADADIMNCGAMAFSDEDALHSSEPTAFECPYGLTVFIMPIKASNMQIGFIKGGHIKISKDLQFFSQASIKAILVQFKKLSTLIAGQYLYKNAQFNESLLAKTLEHERDRVLSIQISNHFLFNTLNAIASLAVKENAPDTYDAIIKLSTMFRYLVKTDSSFVSLKDELSYLKHYCELQKLRFGDRLSFDLFLSEDAESLIIPFNCLQPIVENSFEHGFIDKKGKMAIMMHIRRTENAIEIIVKDNGHGLAKSELKALMERIQASSEGVLNGLAMVYARLRHNYSGMTFEMKSGARGTQTRITLPY